MGEFIIGTSAYDQADIWLMQEAGINWVRAGFHFPFTDRIGGNLSEEYLCDKEKARTWITKGFKVMGTTPGLGIGVNRPDAVGKMRLIWKDGLPAWGLADTDNLPKPVYNTFREGVKRILRV